MNPMGMRAGKCRATDISAGVFTAPAATQTKPSGDGVFEIGNGLIDLIVVGQGADNDTASARIIGWKKYTVQSTAVVQGVTVPVYTDTWIPKILTEVAVTLSQFLGVANGIFGTAYRFADAYAATKGNPTLDSVPAETPASARVNAEGFELIQFDFIKSGTTTVVNGLFKRFRPAA